MELIKKGHKLVSDDRVNITFVRDSLYGEAPELISGVMEIRGIGIVDVGRIFGVNSLVKKIKMIKHHLKLLKETKNDKLALLEIRSHATWYLKGIPNSSHLRSEICKSKTIEELLNLLDNFLKEEVYE